MQPTAIDLILNSELSKKGLKITDPLLSTCVKRAMIAYGFREIDQYRQRENKAAAIESVKIIPSLLKGRFRMVMRKFSFIQAKKQAMIRAETENRKVYVVRASDVSYITLSTKDVENNKRRRIFGKEVDAMRMSEMADFVAYPKRKS